MGEIIGELIITTILNFIGGTIRWIFATLFKSITYRPKRPLKHYIYNSEDDHIHDSPNGCLNIIIGIAFVAFIVIIISQT